MMKRSVRCRRLSLLFLIMMPVAGGLFNAVPAVASERLPLAYFQGLVGAAGFDEEKLTFADPSYSNTDAGSTNDLSTMPYLGIAGQYPLSGMGGHLGIDASLLFGWRSDDTSVVAGDGQARIEIESDLWLLDLAIGIYAQTMLGSRWRLYGAIGPMMLFGDYSDDTTAEDPTTTPSSEKEDSSSESAFGVGGYAKLGLEYRLSADAFMGIVVRGIATNLEFDRAVEDGDLTGIQGFVTFTRAY